MNNQKAYNAWAAIYDNNLNKTRDLDGMITPKILSNYSFKNVLEIGCGTGKNTLWLAEQAKEIWAMDFSKGMLAKLKAKLGNYPLNLHEVDIQEPWPIEAKQVDLAITNLVLEHLQDLNFIFEEAARVLQAKGLFFVSELHPIKQYLGSKAQFEQEGQTHFLDCFVHHISDYLESAAAAGFECIDLQEWFDDKDKKNPPRLVSFVFRLKN
ncbi:MAG: class I SAM-dependent methyltransferase [Aureispira sp.]|nr:class I SAM-dependent methyltransferase [Aureispira sp.]